MKTSPKIGLALSNNFIPKFQGTETLEKAPELFVREVEQLDELGNYPQIPALLAYFTEGSQQYKNIMNCLILRTPPVAIVVEFRNVVTINENIQFR